MPKCVRMARETRERKDTTSSFLPENFVTAYITVLACYGWQKNDWEMGDFEISRPAGCLWALGRKGKAEHLRSMTTHRARIISLSTFLGLLAAVNNARMAIFGW